MGIYRKKSLKIFSGTAGPQYKSYYYASIPR